MAIRGTHTVSFVSSTARTVAGASNLIPLDRYIEGRVYINVTGMAAVGGTVTTPVLVVTMEDTPDSGATFYTHTSSAMISGVGLYAISVSNFGNNLRASWTIGAASGAPSFTFSVVGVFKN